MTMASKGPSITSLLSVLLFTSALTLTRCDSPTDDPLIVQTSKGRVKGATLQALDKHVDAFLGIPYAKPPLGELRFQLPQPADPWSGVLDATKLPNTCVQANLTWFEDIEMFKAFQPNTPLSEDCLTLSVWVPRPRPQGAAVMVWIHGGAFMSGGPNFQGYDPRILCAEEQVIVVSIAYRLASLGFLYLERPDVPGNAGLFDQRMALEWVRDNIRSFGGDPDSVTIFGESAGAASVSYHLLSPLSRDLFSRAIVSSGSIPSPWIPSDNAVVAESGLKLAERLQCPHDPKDMDAIVECMRAKDPLEIVLTEYDMYGFMEFVFLPVVDGKFIPEPIADSLSNKHFKKTEILIGITSDEGTIFVFPFLPEYFDLKKKEVRLSHQEFKTSVKRLRPKLGELVHEAIFYEYTDWNDPENSVTNRDAVGEFVSDSYFICPANAFSRRYAEAGSDVYMYVFSHVPSIHLFPEWMGSAHGFDISFFFGQPLIPAFGLNEQEKKLSKRMMRYWANFARSGNPNKGSNGTEEPIAWPLYTAKDQEYLTLSAKSNEVGKDYKARRCAFWQEYIPTLRHHTGKPKVKCDTPGEAKQEGFSTTTIVEMIVGAIIALIIFLKLW